MHGQKNIKSIQVAYQYNAVALLLHLVVKEHNNKLSYIFFKSLLSHKT